MRPFPLLTALVALLLAAPAARADNRPGALDMGGTVGVFVGDPQGGFDDGFWYGGHITHHFKPAIADAPWCALAFRAQWEGTVTRFDSERRERIDLILLTGTVLWKLQPADWIHPYVGLGAGMMMADGTPSNLPLVPRTVFQPSGGAVVSPVANLFFDLNVRALIHESIPFGVVAVPAGNVAHLVVAFSFGGKV